MLIKHFKPIFTVFFLLTWINYNKTQRLQPMVSNNRASIMPDVINISEPWNTWVHLITLKA